MKTLFTITLVVAAVTFFTSQSSATGLTDTEKEGIKLMREEEKLAHDVYVFLYEKYELPIFNNISRSETKHINAIGFLIDNFDLKDPIKKAGGKFQNKELKDLYDSLTEKGSENVVEALKAGALIEEVDIADLQRLIEAGSDPTVNGVYGNLLRASENHLRAFTGQLKSRDAVYTPTVLTEEVYNEILAGTHQHGGGNNVCGNQQNNCPNKNMPGKNQGRGKGKGRGNGNGCGQKGWN